MPSSRKDRLRLKICRTGEHVCWIKITIRRNDYNPINHNLTGLIGYQCRDNDILIHRCCKNSHTLIDITTIINDWILPYTHLQVPTERLQIESAYTLYPPTKPSMPSP